MTRTMKTEIPGFKFSLLPRVLNMDASLSYMIINHFKDNKTRQWGVSTIRKMLIQQLFISSAYS